MTVYYLDDLHVGQRFTSGSQVLDETQIKRFASEFDPQPFHLDEVAAKATVFGGRLAYRRSDDAVAGARRVADRGRHHRLWRRVELVKTHATGRYPQRGQRDRRK